MLRCTQCAANHGAASLTRATLCAAAVNNHVPSQRELNEPLGSNALGLLLRMFPIIRPATVVFAVLVSCSSQMYWKPVPRKGKRRTKKTEGVADQARSRTASSKIVVTSASSEWYRCDLRDNTGARKSGRKTFRHHDSQRTLPEVLRDSTESAQTCCTRGLRPIGRAPTLNSTRLANIAPSFKATCRFEWSASGSHKVKGAIQPPLPQE